MSSTKRIALHAVVVCLGLSATASRLCAEAVVTTVHTFTGSDGAHPRAALVLGSDGNLYGTTSQGGSGTNPAGTVFRVTPGGSLTSLYTFSFQVTGDSPFGGLLEGGDSLYGTTRGTGTYLGNVFTLGPGGGFTNLHTFSGFFSGPDGSHPEAGLVGSDGNVYGTTSDGGDSNLGTVFRVSAGGSYTILHSFSGLQDPADGFSPRAALAQGSDDTFYGTTSGGDLPGAHGTVFSITPGGSVTTLHTFSGSDGSGPVGTLVRGSDDTFYGTTSAGGANVIGTVYRISPGGSFETLYSFSAFGGQGYSPQAALVQGSDVDFFGTTSDGGGGACPGGCGAVYKLSPVAPTTTTTTTTTPDVTTTSATAITTSSTVAAASTTTVSLPSTTSTTAPCVLSQLPDDSLAGVECAIGTARATLRALPAPLCGGGGRCRRCSLESALDRVAGFVMQAETGASAKKCTRSLRGARRAARTLGGKVASLTRSGCLAPADRAARLAPEVLDLSARIKALLKSRFCASQ